MGRRVIHCQLFLLLGLILCSGSSVTEKEAIGHKYKQIDHSEKKQLQFFSSISTTQTDITNPIITPTTPTTPNPTIPVTTTPTSIPAPPATMTPTTTTTPTTTSPVSASASWCIATQTASETALQVALDYACGYGGADCSAIQPGGSCYNSNTIHDHASYAFNDYYQKNPVPTSCNFGGTAVITTTDPSSGTCQYPPTSTSATVLNTTNPSGSTVFGSQPASSSSSVPNMPRGLSRVAISACLMLLLLAQIQFSSI